MSDWKKCECRPVSVTYFRLRAGVVVGLENLLLEADPALKQRTSYVTILPFVVVQILP